MYSQRLTQLLGALTFALIAWLTFTTSALAASQIEIAIDASGSMVSAIDGSTRMEVAKKTITETFADLDASIALRAFGHNYSNSDADKPKSCLDSELLVDFTTDFTPISAAVAGLEPSGWTPLAYTIAKAGEDLKPYADQNPVLIVLSDGLDSCDGDPAAEAKKLKDAGINVTVHVIGFAVDAATRASLEALAEAGMGNYYSANNATELATSFEEIVEVEKVPAKAAADSISTSGADIMVEGGATFDDAKPFPRDILGQEFSLSQHLVIGAAETFTLEVNEGDVLNVYAVRGEKGIKGTPEPDGTVLENERYNISSILTFFKPNKVKIDAANVSGAPLGEGKDKVRFSEAGTVYFFIHPSDNSSYGTPQDTRYTLTLNDKDGNPVGGTPATDDTEPEESASTDTTNSESEADETEKKDKEWPIDKDIVYIIAGLVALLFIYLIVRALKK